MNNATDTRDDDTHQRNPEHDGPKSQQQLEREVEQARARLGRTANELSDRLSPGELFEQALDVVREHGGEFSRNLGNQVKNNPMPMVLSSLGISWMMMSSGKTETQNGHTTAADRAQDAGANMKESAQNARESLERFYRDKPLIAGSLGIALGAALGALVPETEMEDEVFGEASDRSVEAAKSTAAKEYSELRDSVRPN